jgi:UDP-glucose 4-epimerase
VYLGNLVHALIRCLERAATEATFHVADREVVSTPELVRRLAAAGGRRARLFPVPPGVLRLAGAALGRRDAVARLVDSLVVDAGLIARVLNWSPPYTLDDGLACTVAKA